MCEFFSFNSDVNGKLYFFDWELRKKILKKELRDSSGIEIENADSHSSISAYFKLDDDKVNKWEYNPLLKILVIDTLKLKDNKEYIEKQVKMIDFKKIVEPLIIKKIINPLTIKREMKTTKKEIELLKKWDSVRNSVWDSVRNSVWDSVWDSVWNSVGDSVGDSVRNSVWDSVRDSVWDSVRNSVWDSVWDSVGDSVRNSVWDSVRNSVWDSVGIYISSFLGIKYKHDFSSGIKLWEAGLVPSFDGKVWRLHAGEKAKVVYVINFKEAV